MGRGSGIIDGALGSAAFRSHGIGGWAKSVSAMRWISVMLVLGSGCTGLTDDDGTNTDDTDVVVDTDVPDEFVFEADPVVLPTTEELGVAISMFMEQVPYLNTDGVFAMRSSQATYETPSCPAWVTQGNLKTWTHSGTGCVNADSSQFQGKFAIPIDFEDRADTDVRAIFDKWLPVYKPVVTVSWSQRLVDGRSILGESIISDPDGVKWELSGEFERLKVRYDDMTMFLHTLAGDHNSALLDESDSSWEALGWRPDLTLIDLKVNDTALHHRQVIGSVGGVSLGIATAFEFSEFLLAHEALGASCEIEPSGTVGVRDGSGRWIDVIFDGSNVPGEEVPVELCDGCGEAFYGDESLGTVCAEFLPMLGEPEVETP